MKKIFKIVSLVTVFSLIITANIHIAHGQQATMTNTQTTNTMMTTPVAGCFPGYLYSTVNGQSCSASGAVDNGCTGTNIYSTTTAARCPMVPTSTVVVCGPGQMYNISTGALCSTTTPGFPNTGGVNPVVDFVTLASAAIMLAGGVTLLIVRRFAR